MSATIYKVYQLDDGEKGNEFEYFLHQKDTYWANHCCKKGDMLVEEIQVSKTGKRYAEAMESTSYHEPCCNPEDKFNDAVRWATLVTRGVAKPLTPEELAAQAFAGKEEALLAIKAGHEYQQWIKSKPTIHLYKLTFRSKDWWLSMYVHEVQYRAAKRLMKSCPDGITATIKGITAKFNGIRHKRSMDNCNLSMDSDLSGYYSFTLHCLRSSLAPKTDYYHDFRNFNFYCSE